MKENRNLACDHIEPCNIEQSERHNRRDPEYIASLDPRTIYVRLELTHNNNVYVAPDVEGKTLQDVYEEIKVMVKQKTGRRMQERIVEITDKKGRKKKRNGSSPLRESVVRIKSNTTMDDLMRYAQKVHERWGVRAIQIHIHRDEGHYVDPDNPKTWIPNLHAHIIWDWMNHETGKSYKLNGNDCKLIQDMVADSLGMERGMSKEETGAEHLMRNDYILQKQKKELNELKEQTEEAQKDLQTTIDDCNLLQAEKEYARETLQDLRQEAADEQQRLNDEYEEKRKELDESLAEKRKENNMLNACNKLRSKRSSELDDEITKKTMQSTQLDDDITAKSNKITLLNTQISKAIEEKYEIKNLSDWQEPMFTGMSKYLYAVDEMVKFCVDAVIDFAKSGSGCCGGNHGSYFYDEESSAIKALMFRFAKLAATSIEHVAQWLVWLAKELGQLTNMELHRADTEVRDIVEGKYDWRIERFENHRGDGLSV